MNHGSTFVHGSREIILFFHDSRQLKIGIHGSRKTPFPTLFARHSSNVVFEEFVPSSLIASPLIKPLFTPGGWHEVKWVY